MKRLFSSFRGRWRSRVNLILAFCQLLFASFTFGEQPPQSLQLSRPVRSWEFVSAVGKRAALFGNEQGTLEAWVYPLKILRDFHLRFHTRDAAFPAEPFARTLVVRPESSTIVYTGDVFSVRETLFVPVHESGAIVAFEVETAEPLEIEVLFTRDFQLEWPATFEGANDGWDPSLRAFRFGELSGRFEAIVGSPSGAKSTEELSTNYFSSRQNSMLLGVTTKGIETKLVVIAAETSAPQSVPQLYDHLAKGYPELLRESASYYREYLDRTVKLNIPDTQIEDAYNWAKVSILQGIVENPFLGEGLIAGYNKSGDDGRPGFAWFFGRDSEWTSLALDAEGDFATTREALEFLSKYQRADGKVPHEISQSAGFVDWFKTPYAYASADATPLFIVAVNDYVTQSGDVDFARKKWDDLWRAYGFLQSTYDARGLAQNLGAGTGWIEEGPLYPARTELYQASLGVEALRALSHLAQLLGKEDLSKQLKESFEREQLLLDETFWSPEHKIYGYALDKNDNREDDASVLATVPMWFQQLNEHRARSMIEELAAPDQQSDWGMRIISARNPHYNPGGYHYGSVWPLFTGWASVGEYRYHRALAAYSNLRANALLTFDGSLGHVAEVLSGDYFQTLSTGSPQQIWSAAMVVSPVLSGLMGLRADASDCHLDFAPHVPAEWEEFSVDNVHLGAAVLSLNYQRTPGSIRMQMRSRAGEKCWLHFSPAVSLRATITQVRLNGTPIPFHIEVNEVDQHVTVTSPIAGDHNVVEIQMKNDFEIGEASSLPVLGAKSQGLRVLSESWTPKRDALSLLLSGASGESYELSAWNAGQILSVEGADLEEKNVEKAKVRVRLPVSTPGSDPKATIIFHFVAK